MHSISSTDLGVLELTDLEYYFFKEEEKAMWKRYRALHRIGIKKEKQRLDAFQKLLKEQSK